MGSTAHQIGQPMHHLYLIGGVHVVKIVGLSFERVWLSSLLHHHNFTSVDVAYQLDFNRPRRHVAGSSGHIKTAIVMLLASGKFQQLNRRTHPDRHKPRGSNFAQYE